jgi:hypothetical protein
LVQRIVQGSIQSMDRTVSFRHCVHHSVT